MSLRDALINNKITIEEILEKAYKDVKRIRQYLEVYI